VVRAGQPAPGISSIHEGEQVRASFDPSSYRAEKLEVVTKSSKKHHHGSTTPATPPPSSGEPATPPPNK
jgi:hypothetical protein